MADDRPDFSKLDAVQDLLERNRAILAEIKANHERNTAESLASNCELIKELNNNIAKVVELYKDVADNFQEFMLQQQPNATVTN